MRTLGQLLKPIVIVVLLSLIASISGSVVGAAEMEELTWQIEIKAAFTSEQMQQPGWEENTRALQSALTTRLQNNGTHLEMARAPSARGTDLIFRANGKGTAAQFRRVAFDDFSPLGGLIGGPAALTLNGAVQRGESLSLVLESNPSTGYAWDIRSLDAAMFSTVGQSQFQPKANLPGAPAKQTIHLNAMQDGSASLTLVYHRPWETTEPTRRVTLSATRLTSLADITNPLAPPVQPAPNLPVRVSASPSALPSHFNWASTDNPKGAPQVTAIRDQGTCGSCWAFATVAPFESNILWKDSVSTNLSEQYLLSCNTDGWNCDGGWWAHKYHYDTLGFNQTAAGAVYESAFPYVAYQAPCNAAYSHPYKLNNWYSLGTYPTVEAIKNAIYNYGPVSAALCAGTGFSNYTGGIFSGNDCPAVGINHAITLVGWDDATGIWVLRNSWGPSWGESAYPGGERGYMRIVYGASQVGYGASYVVYNGAASCYNLTTSVNPSGSGSVLVSPSPNCNGTQYTPGTVVTLTAQPGCGRTFLNWSGDLAGSINPTTITMDGHKNVTANFSASSSPCSAYFPFILKNQDVAGWTTILSEDFEGSFPSAWALYGTNGYTWGKRNCRAYAGSFSGWGVGGGTNGATKSCGTNYPDSVESWMVYGPFSLVGATAADLKFKLWLNTPGYPDRLSYYASIDGNYFYGYFSYPTSGWTDGMIDLSNVYTLGNLLGQPNVWIAFRFYSDSSNNAAEGAYIDNIVLRKCPAGATCPVSASSPSPANGETSEIPFRVTKQSK